MKVRRGDAEEAGNSAEVLSKNGEVKKGSSLFVSGELDSDKKTEVHSVEDYQEVKSMNT